MKRTSKKMAYAFALSATIGAVAIAGCGGGSSSTEAASGGAGGEGAATASNRGAGGTIGTAPIEGLGTVLVDSSGMTVYEYTPDEGTRSNCYGECAAAWPPVVGQGKPTAGEGAMAAALGTTKRKDGTLQVTYDGHPLYTFVEDSAPGEANGNEVEGIWFVLNEGGAAVKGRATGGESESAPASEGNGGGSHGY